VINDNIGIDDFTQFVLTRGKSLKDKYKGALHFENALSFEKLIEYIRDISVNDKSLKGRLASEIIEKLGSDHPFLSTDLKQDVINENEELLKEMMMFVFPEAFYTRHTYAASIPFREEFFYATPKFKEVADFENNEIIAERNISDEVYEYGKNIAGYASILSIFYKVESHFSIPIIYRITNPVSGLDRHFKVNTANEFLHIHCKTSPKRLTQEQLTEAKMRIYDINFMKDLLEPENYVFRGFLVVNLINVTDTAIISDIKNDLLEKNSVTVLSGFLKLQHKLKSLINCSGLLLGLSSYCGSSVIKGSSFTKIGHSFIGADAEHVGDPISEDTIHGQAILKRKISICHDLKNKENRSKLEDSILDSGIRNILVAPLIHENAIVGVLELCSSTPGMISPINSLKLSEIFPLLSLAVSGIIDDRNSRIDAIIKEKCTAIHSSLEWRFREAASVVLSERNEGRIKEIEDIVFDNVYSLYGLSDIRNSSVQRSISINDDLIENLELASETIGGFPESKGNLALEQLKHKISEKIKLLQVSIDSPDVANAKWFVREELNPVLKHFGSLNDSNRKLYEEYVDRLDGKLGVIYKKRRQYEDSASSINNFVASILDVEQAKIQEVFPHYFERFKTDGVDHTIYIGQSMVKDRKFEVLYLKNLRIWQLNIMCKIARETALMKPELPVPLDTAHLILIQGSPLSIRFRYDEKKFDVDGTYNVRYEILKKRIDKVRIRGLNERLTQPAKIALVYAAREEIGEYLEYIKFLQSKYILLKDLEEFELEELQGVSNLKAIRVGVNLNAEQSSNVSSES
jgi:putative methionine-R-sulfoxide reductase with GAF domain